MKVEIVVNPASGQDAPFLGIFNTVFGQAGVDWDVHITKEAGDGERLARLAVAGGADVVGAFGGDGTVMEVASGLMQSRVPLAILPGGTGNVVAVELGIPRDLTAACSLIVDPDPCYKSIDVGRLDRKCFLLRVGIGLEADMVDKADRSMKDQYGSFAYIISAIQSLREPEMAQYRLTMDGTTQDCAGIACIIANIGSLGVPGLNLSPGIEPSDGLLDVLVIQKADLPGLISLAASVVGGSENQNSMLHWQAKSISVEALPPQLVQVDGEMAGRSPVNVTIMEKALRVLIPRPSDQQM